MIEYERLSFESGQPQVDHEYALFQALVNEGKHIRVLNTKRPQFSYNGNCYRSFLNSDSFDGNLIEKQLRDAAAAEVMTKISNGANDVNIDDDDGKSSTRKRKHLDPDEKQKQSRDRNREHAKNTRLRKKAYVTKLKELVDQLTRQKDIDERERRILGEKVHDTQVIRRNAVRLFLLYRGACITDPQKWSKIVEEASIFILPITPYRSFSRTEIENNCRTIIGIEGIIADCCSLALMAETLGMNNEEWYDSILRGETSTISYSIDPSASQDSMLAAGELVMCPYILKTESGFDGHDQESCVQYGMLQCRFNKKNKIVSAEMMYDVMGFMQQLQKISMISPENSIVPNTLDMALQPSKEPRVIIAADGMRGILNVNDEWTYLTGLTQADCEGKSMESIIEFRSALKEQFVRLVEDAVKGRPGSRLLFYRPSISLDHEDIHFQSKIDHQKYRLGYMRAIPLTTDSEKMPTHVLLILFPSDRSLAREDEEKLIARLSFISGTTVSTGNIRRKTLLATIDAFESEFSRQITSYQNRYNNSQAMLAPVGPMELNSSNLALNSSMSGNPKSAYANQLNAAYQGNTNEEAINHFFLNSSGGGIHQQQAVYSIPTELMSKPTVVYPVSLEHQSMMIDPQRQNLGPSSSSSQRGHVTTANPYNERPMKVLEQTQTDQYSKQSQYQPNIDTIYNSSDRDVRSQASIKGYYEYGSMNPHMEYNSVTYPIAISRNLPNQYADPHRPSIAYPYDAGHVPYVSRDNSAVDSSKPTEKDRGPSRRNDGNSRTTFQNASI